MKNPILEAIEDGLMASLETDDAVARLPDAFTIHLDDAAFQVLLKGLVHPGTNKQVDQKLKRVTMRILGFLVTIRSDLDPEPWPNQSKEMSH